MTTKFSTPPISTGGTAQSSSDNTLLYVIIGAALLYAGYVYIVKPELEKRKAQEATQNK